MQPNEKKEEEDNTSNQIKLKLLETLHGHEESVWCCSWNPNKTILATCSSDKLIRLWSKSSTNTKFACIQTCDAHSRTVRSISWNPSGKIFASSSFDGSIGIWKMKSERPLEFECIELLEGHDNEIKCTSWNANGNLLATCSRDKSVWIWEMDSLDEFEVVAVKRSHDADVKCVQWHPFEDYLVSCSYDDTIKSYKCDDMEDDWFINQIFKCHKSTVWKVAFDPLNGNQFVSCSDDQSIAVWEKMKVTDINLDDMAYRLKQRIENVHDEAIYCVDWLRDEECDVIATCSGDNSIKLFMKNGEEKDEKWKMSLHQKDAHTSDINGIAFGRRIGHGKYLIATASDDGTTKIWEMSIEESLTSWIMASHFVHIPTDSLSGTPTPHTDNIRDSLFVLEQMLMSHEHDHRIQDSMETTIANSTTINAWFPLRGKINPITPTKRNKKSFSWPLKKMSLSQSRSDENIIDFCIIDDQTTNSKKHCGSKKNKRNSSKKLFSINMKKKKNRRLKSDQIEKTKCKKKRKLETKWPHF